MNRLLRVLALGTALALPLTATGCAGSIRSWIVQTRDRQADAAYARRSDAEASQAYRLALDVDPADQHARSGLVNVQLRLARLAFSRAKTEDALAELAVADKAAPGDDRIAGLRNEIEQAQIRRDIVASNFPAYRDTGASLRRSYRSVGEAAKRITGELVRFDYSYDTNAVTAAVRESYALSSELVALTNRLVQYRQFVETGVPESSRATTLAPPASLLPLP